MQYRVTTKAGPKVAGRNANPGDVLDLTEPEARYELMAGTIEPHEPPAPATADTAPPAAEPETSEPAVKPASKRR
ncbi:hypothetical protein [Prosthecodimorpha staleyi]|uniref:Uncharacterized protein n=1 Tax=Prosthecodimorpha staleyi TaxID=2840188 RepID=A0A947DC80_9HYPH|nr:hypothetical protein [Prosthecodimorpha staleyi]MBT9293352.1 hypothetical protein [Prosthecodimorpha staleyi]